MGTGSNGRIVWGVGHQCGILDAGRVARERNGLVRDPLWKTQQPPAQGDVTAHL